MTAPAQTPYPVEFESPLVNPSPNGLYPATSWTDESGAPRWLASGVRIRPHNFGGEDAFGLWGADWCDPEPGELKEGERPAIPDPFDPLTAWAFDQCDLTAPSQAEVRARALQNLRIIEQVAVEREFAARLLMDAGTPAPAADIIAAVSHVEAEFAKTNTTGLIHAPASLAAVAQRYGLVIGSAGGSAPRSPLGHTWVFGGGYTEGLGDTIVGTGPTFGWRDQPVLREAIEARYNQFVAVAERSVVIGYEKAVAAATIT